MIVFGTPPIALDSRSPGVRSVASPYMTSEYWVNTWGQPPASHYVFHFDGSILRGQLIESIYLTFHVMDAAPLSISPMLKAEMDAWEAASDEDVANFELGLDG
ncbi:MAG: hypothetical protein HY260_08880 [Chloroflexi bacterium]|nr:hypothetical protein [Chloroflexota bacterium]